jgi:pSer/pThr/pTyr-binding forkhead associated (FHA) protein
MDISPNLTDYHILLINDRTNRVILLDAERYSIGRSSSNAIVLDRDPISREHASLLRVAIPNEDRFIYRLIDGDSAGKLSTNGIFVNEQRETSCNLSNEDTIAFGGVVKALYIHAAMDEIQFSEFVELCTSESLSVECSENWAAIRQVASYLSSNDSTSIMLGGRPTELKDTLALR